MRRNGYDSYHGRSRVRTFLKVLIVLLLVVLAVAVGALLWLEPYIDYSANGIKINLPFFQQKEPAPATGAPVVVTTPEPTPTPEPEEDFRGILLPNSALYDGTAAQQVEAAGATAALFDMKADDGSLGYISGLALAIQAEASAADPALNAAIQLLNGGEVYTVARVSCFRDNLVPRSDMTLAIHTNAGNWRDSGDTCWLSPANESARQYVVGVCRELAALGFDEILLDNWAFPTDGEPDPGGARAGAGGAGPGGLGRADHDRRIVPKSGRIALCVRFFRRFPAEEAEGKRIMLKSKLIILNLKFSPI